MIKKVGRNELCPCGSGEKYKKCCILTPPSFVSSEIVDFSWHRLRQTEGKIIDNHLLPYVNKELTDEIIVTALNEFFPESLIDKMDSELLFNCFFIPWFLFNWIPTNNFNMIQFDPMKTIAQNYLKIHEKKLDAFEKSFIEAMNQTYYSFYSVLEIKLNKLLIVKDILLGTIHTIKEKMATHTLKRGDITFTRILTLDDQSIFIGMAPYTIPVHYQRKLINIKQWLVEENNNCNLDAIVLREQSFDKLVYYFFEIMEECYNQPLPSLLNTDGDPILFSKSYFEISITPVEAAERLLPLTLSKDIKEFLDDAECNPSGVIKKIELPWLKKGNKQHKNWDNTVMGNICLKKNKLILETNSKKRTQIGKKLLNKYLGEDVNFQKTLIESPEQKLKSTSNKHNKNQMNSEMLKSPEIQEQLKQMAKAHWENWFDEPIPALNNQTPYEAAKTKEGKERLELLLLEYENRDLHQNEAMYFFKADIDYLKKKLKLS